jgi:hypothetical protein
VKSLVVQPDGKIVAGGSFTSLAGQPRNRIARLNADGTLSPVEGSFYKLLGAAKDKALPRIHTVVVHPNQKDIPPELSDPHTELRVFKAWTLEEAVQRIVVDEQTRWGEIPDFLPNYKLSAPAVS